MKKKMSFREWWKQKKLSWNETYEKRLCTLITVNAILWVWCSYILAWCGRYEIAQYLSQTAITSILGVVIAYSVKSLGENISKYGYKGRQEKIELPKIDQPVGNDDEGIGKPKDS